MNVKICKSFLNCTEEKTLLLIKKGYPIKECKKCGHRFTQIKDVDNHLNEVYSDKYFFQGKDGYPDYMKEKDLLYKSGINYANILSKYTQPGEVLDVGSAAGFILKGLEKSGWRCHGIEPNDTMATYGRDELKLDIQTCGLENYQSEKKFDLVNMIQVIGSLYDLDKSLLIISNLLNKNGLVMVESWDMNSLAARIMGKYWHEYCPPSVITWFSDKTLVQVFNFYGFELVGKGHPSKKININHGLSLIDESFPKFIFKKSILNFFSRIVGKYNISYPTVDLKWYLFKKL
ncbi:MAG: class I SAM-dependent methyltransferase [Bacteroidota bacterium]|nr:class I SAM-dependent methyltransferase [Bacteroidota bacterium]